MLRRSRHNTKETILVFTVSGSKSKPSRIDLDSAGNRAGTASSPEPVRGVRFPVHARVEHVEWGPGEVIRRDEDRLTVLFHESGYRELLLSAVLAEDLLHESG